jgi:hypothetical protein
MEKPKYFYRDLIERKDIQLETGKKTLEIYNSELIAELEIACDFTASDTARQFRLRELPAPSVSGANLFSTAIDELEYNNMLNSIKNFLSQKERVSIPMFYNVNRNLQFEYQRDTGLILKDVNGGRFLVPAVEVPSFLQFLMALPFIANN